MLLVGKASWDVSIRSESTCACMMNRAVDVVFSLLEHIRAAVARQWPVQSTLVEVLGHSSRLPKVILVKTPLPVGSTTESSIYSGPTFFWHHVTNKVENIAGTKAPRFESSS